MDGYIYCFSNQSMPGILKIGLTERIPTKRLAEANKSDTFKPPTNYKIEFAKKVKNIRQKECTLHKLLSKYTERINPKREFFRVSLEEVKLFFDLMDGEWWDENNSQNYEQENKVEDILDNLFLCDEKINNTSQISESTIIEIIDLTNETVIDLTTGTNHSKSTSPNSTSPNLSSSSETDSSTETNSSIENNSTIKHLNIKPKRTIKKVPWCRDMSKCFSDGQKIRHHLNGNGTWVGIYNKALNLVEFEDNFYTLNQFVKAHYKKERPHRIAANAWQECEYEVDGQWISTYQIKI